MMLGMAAATSAIDLVKSLTEPASSKKTSGSSFKAATGSSATTTTGFSTAPTLGGSSLIAPDTMNALFASQSDGSSAAGASRSSALKELFKLLDGDGDGRISKSEFESALGAGGTNTTNADNVFSKLDTDGDGSVSMDELASALKSKHHAHRPKPSGQDSDPLMQALDAASGNTTTNSDGSTTTSLTYADGSTVTMTQPKVSTGATQAYNAIEQAIQRQAAQLAQSASTALSVSV